MDVLTKKSYESGDYLYRYSTVPFYYHTIDEKYIYGLGSNMKKDTAYVLHKIKQGDTLDNLALEYYNNPTLYWVIAYFNNIWDVFIDLTDYFTELKIPTITAIEFGDER